MVEGWSFGAVMNGFEASLDEEGRPIHEGRAPAIVKEGVPMRMKRCPYPDERKGRMMNLSALGQITRHLDAVVNDVGSFRRMLDAERPGWGRVWSTFADQLLQTAAHQLRSPRRDPRIPVTLSVGYKVAAGYLVPLRQLLELDLQGRAPEVSVDGLLDYVRTHRSLVGAREVCAAPMSMVTRVTESAVNGVTEPGPVRRERVVAAKILRVQTEVGIAWKLFDAAIERRVLGWTTDASHLRPRTDHLRRRLDERLARIGAEAADAGVDAWPPRLPEEVAARLAPHLRLPDTATTPAPAARVYEQLLDHGEGALVLPDDPALRRELAALFAAQLAARRSIELFLEERERALRLALGFDPDAPVRLDPSTFPPARALDWLEMIAGHRVRAGVGGELWMKNQHRTVALPVR